jgi:hypothetical protein
MKSNKKEIQKKLIQTKDKIGHYNIDLDFFENETNTVSAKIDTDFKRITIEYGKKLNLVPDELTKTFVRRAQIKDPELDMGIDLVHHETGHFENPKSSTLGFPYSTEINDANKEAIFKELVKKNKHGMTNYVNNMFIDIFDNVNCRKNTSFYGQTLFWNNQGLKSEKGVKYDGLYEVFVKYNLILGGDVKSYTFLKRFFENTKEVKKAQDGFINDLKSMLDLEKIINFHQKEGYQKVFNTNLEERKKLSVKLAQSFAKNVADLVQDTPSKEKLFGSGEETDENSDDYNPFDKMMQDPSVAQKIAYDRFKEGKGAAIHREKKEQLFDLYRAISKEISIETTEYSKSESMPIIYFGKKEFTENDKKLRFRGLGIDNNGDFFVKTTRYEIDEPATYKVHPRNFPKLKICLMDRSGSMCEDPEGGDDVGNTNFIPWGDNSKYHYALKGKFGIDNFLERQGIAPYVRDVALGWSGESIVEGDYKTVSKSLLETPRGNTFFEIDKLEKVLNIKSLVLSISDGECSVNDNLKKRLDKKLTECDMAHVQIGYTLNDKNEIIKNNFCEYLESRNIPVFYVKGNDDLSKIMINFVSKYYKSLSK